MKFKIGKRYLTRDWKVVRYDGTQDVVARVYAHKPGRFKDDEDVCVVGNESMSGCASRFRSMAKYWTLFEKGDRWLMVRVSDLPDDMKGGPKP